LQLEDIYLSMRIAARSDKPPLWTQLNHLKNIAPLQKQLSYQWNMEFILRILFC